MERRYNFDGRVLGDVNQSEHVPILDLSNYNEDGSTVSWVAPMPHPTLLVRNAFQEPTVELGLGVLRARTVT